jgi:hypothetical protein
MHKSRQRRSWPEDTYVAVVKDTFVPEVHMCPQLLLLLYALLYLGNNAAAAQVRAASYYIRVLTRTSSFLTRTVSRQQRSCGASSRGQLLHICPFTTATYVSLLLLLHILLSLSLSSVCMRVSVSRKQPQFAQLSHTLPGLTPNPQTLNPKS